jgi:alkaline phosphatase D
MKPLGALLHLKVIVFSILAFTAAIPAVTNDTLLTKLAFGSCHKSKYATGDVWASIAATSPQVFLWVGDSVYPPTRGIASIELLKREYRAMLDNTTVGYHTLQPPLGMYGMYDDHDWGGNDVGQGMPDKRLRKEAFFDFLGYPSQFLAERPGAYHSVDLGPPGQQIKILMLDTRWFRDDHCIPSFATTIPLGAGLSCITRWLTAGLLGPFCSSKRTMLGQDQWTWLEEELAHSKAQVHIVVSSIQVLTTNPVVESWGHFPAERKRLLKLLNGVSGAIVLSGDVHHGELLGDDHFLYEVTSSGLTHSCTLPFYGSLCEPLLTTFTAHRMGAADQYYIGRNFGTMEMDWELHQVKVNVHDALGITVLTTGWKPMRRERRSDVQLTLVPAVMDGHLVKRFQLWLIAVLIVLFGAVLQVFAWKAYVIPRGVKAKVA